MDFEIIPTERLSLRLMTPAVYDFVFANYTDEALKDFFGLLSDEALQTKKSNYEDGLVMFNKSFCYFQLLEQGGFIGWCGFHTWYTHHSRAELGYGLTVEHAKQKGYMTEVLPYVLRHGFEQMHLNRIEALIGPDNIPSLKLVEKFGFTKEGVLRSHYYKNGYAEDSVVYSLLRNEYIAQRLPGSSGNPTP